MPACAVRYCTNYTGKTSKCQGITYHSFPTNEKRRIQWETIMREQRREEAWQANKHTKICSLHFKDEDKYTSGKGLTLLKKSAVPVFEQLGYAQTPASPNSLDDEELSDTEYIFGSCQVTEPKVCVEIVTPEEQKIIIENKNTDKQRKRLQTRLVGMKVILKRLRNNKYISDEQYNELNVNKEAIILFNKILRKKRSKKSFRLVYPPALRKFALTIHFHSQTAYNYARRLSRNILPHPNVLGKWYENRSLSPGFTKQAFDLLQRRNEFSGKRMICALVVAEMALRPQFKWSGKKTDVVDFGGIKDSNVIATEAYVLLIAALDEDWKLPVGYFLVNGISGETRAHLISSCLRKCYDIGVDVVALSFDGCPANFSAANILGCDLKDPNNLKTTFKHPSCDTEVALFFDSLHLIQLITNTFKSKKLIFNAFQNEIKWNLLSNLCKLQQSQSLNFENKHSGLHITFRNEILKVDLSTRWLSRSVAKALEISERLLVPKRFKKSSATVEFIELFNDLFDVFNSRSKCQFGFKKSICMQNATEIIRFLDNAKNYILSLKIYNKTKRATRREIIFIIKQKRLVDCKCKLGFIGFLVCIESMKYLYKTLIENQSLLRRISTNSLSQDHVDLLFGNNGGRSHTCLPNAIQFKAIYKSILNKLMFRCKFTGKCIPLERVPILNSLSPISNINWSSYNRAFFDDVDSYKKPLKTSSDRILQENVDTLALLLNKVSLPYYEQIVGYISGWIARKMIDILKCNECINSLLTSEKMWYHKLITIRDMSGLCYSAESLFTVCLKSEKILKGHRNKNGRYKNLTKHNEMDIIKISILKSFVDSNVFGELKEHAMTQPVTLNHRTLLLKAIIEEYINIRMKFEPKHITNVKQNTKSLKRNSLNLFYL